MGHPIAIHFDGAHLYWATEALDDMTTTGDGSDVLPNSGAIWRSALSAGTGSWGAPEALVQGLATPLDMVVDDEWVYWISSAGSVNKVAKAGGAAIPLATGQSALWRIAQDEASLYWTNTGHTTGNITRLAK